MYCFFADLLGFKNIILNLPEPEQNIRINQWIEIVDSAANSNDLTDYGLISDSIVGISEEDDDGFKNIVNFSKELLEKGLEKNCLIRGAISKGEISKTGHIFFGKALIEGYQSASDQNWIGVRLGPDLIPNDQYWDVGKIIQYPTPLKGGRIPLNPVIMWNIPSIQELFNMTTGGGLTKKNDLLTWDFYTKLQNTAIFSLYIKAIKKIERTEGKRVNFRKFYGITPLDVVESIIDDRPLKIA